MFLQKKQCRKDFNLPQKKHRVEAHLLISVLAYQTVHAIRMKMRANEERSSWQQIRLR